MNTCAIVAVLFVDRDLNAATNLAKLATIPKSGVDSHRTGSSPGMGREGAEKSSSLSGELAPADEASMVRKGLSGRKAGTR